MLGLAAVGHVPGRARRVPAPRWRSALVGDGAGRRSTARRCTPSSTRTSTRPGASSPCRSRSCSAGGWFSRAWGGASARRRAVLLALFALVLVFAYPLAAPIPAVPIVVFVWLRVAAQAARRASPSCACATSIRGRRRSLLWLIPLCALLVVPAIGVGTEGGGRGQGAGSRATRSRPGAATCPASSRSTTSCRCRARSSSCRDGRRVRPGGLRPAPLGTGRSPSGSAGLLAIGVLLAVYLRHRAVRLLLPLQAAGLHRPAGHGDGRGRARPACAAGARRCWRCWWWRPRAAPSPSSTPPAPSSRRRRSSCASWARSLPRGRLDPPGHVAARRSCGPPTSSPRDRLCSQLPLLDTDYPHVHARRKADYIVATHRHRPARRRRRPGRCGATAATACTARTRPCPDPTPARSGALTASTPASASTRDERLRATVPPRRPQHHQGRRRPGPAAGAAGGRRLGHGRARRPGPRRRAHRRPLPRRARPSAAPALRRRPGRAA